MKTLLVIAPEPVLAAAIRAALDPERYRVLQQSDLSDDELLLNPVSIDACILDADLTSIEPIRTIQRLRRSLPRCPLIVYATAVQWEWEEDAYLLGASHVLGKPVRGKLLDSLLERLWPAKPLPERPVVQEVKPKAESTQPPVKMLESMLNYSSLLTHSLAVEPLLKEFLSLLRGIIGINRAAIFLRPPPGSLSDTAEPGAARQLRAACSNGLTPALLEYFQLSLEGGIGGHVFRSGRILRRQSEEVAQDVQMQKEFELLGAQVVIPILDRESFIGLAVFDGRVTGETLTNEELAAVFHLFEQTGQAIRNIWAHERISAGHEMMSAILRQMNSGCLVIARDLSILHANDMAKTCFARNNLLSFNDLPQTIGSKVYEVLKGGPTVAGEKLQVAEKTYRVAIAPFQKNGSTQPNAAMVVLDDITQSERVQHLEIETANLRLVKQMADRLAHEIGNAIVPLSTHQQLLHERIEDPEFQQSLDDAMQDSIKRVTRLLNQMRYLARDRVEKSESVPVKKLIEEAFQEARLYHPADTVLLQVDSSHEPLTVTGDRIGLQHAMAEIILNALQANGRTCQVHVKTSAAIDAGGSRWAQIEVHDGGAGFTPETASKASEPFFTTRNVGLGLGLAVTDRIIQIHQGKMEIPQPQAGQPGLVRITLPLEAKVAAN